MRHRIYFLLGVLTGAIGVYLLVQKSLAEVARIQRSDEATKELLESYAEEDAARRAKLTPEQRIRLEIMKQEYRMEALENIERRKQAKEEKKRDAKN